MEIVPGVHQVEGGRGGNIYLLVDDKLALIDTGMTGNSDSIIRYIRELGRDPKDLETIILTHGHFDHIGSSYKLREITGAKTVAHADEVIRNREGKYVLSPVIETSQLLLVLLVLWAIRMILRYSGIEVPLSAIITLRVISLSIGLLIMGFISVPRLWLERVLFRFAKFNHRIIDTVVKDRDVLPYLDGIQVIYTPGHTPGSISLFLPKRKILFVGDTIINNINRLSRPLPLRSNRDEAEQSLNKLAELDFDIVCFGHGPPMYSAKEKVTQLSLRYPRAPVWWRIIRNWQRLIRFTIGLLRRSKTKEKPQRDK